MRAIVPPLFCEGKNHKTKKNLFSFNYYPFYKNMWWVISGGGIVGYFGCVFFPVCLMLMNKKKIKKYKRLGPQPNPKKGVQAYRKVSGHFYFRSRLACSCGKERRKFVS
jgi:hypothetical protein